MSSYTSAWRERKEHKNNKRNAVILFVTTFIIIVFFITFGLPLIVKFAAFLSEIRSSSIAVDKSDTTPPPPPLIYSLPKYSNIDKIEIKGSSEPGSTVIVYGGLGESETLVGSDSIFSLELLLSDGENTFYAISKDLSGNVSRKTNDYVIIHDKTVPDLSISKPTNGQKFYGDSQRQLSIEGVTEKDSVVNINSSRAIIHGEGQFSLLVILNEGENVFNITANDPSGNITETSLSVYFYP